MLEKQYIRFYLFDIRKKKFYRILYLLIYIKKLNKIKLKYFKFIYAVNVNFK